MTIIDVGRLKSDLKNIAAKKAPERKCLSEIIAEIYVEINDLLIIGYTYRQISEALASRGIKISVGTLEQYIYKEGKLRMKKEIVK